MAKNVRWKIPFVAIDGTKYRVDIYDEGTFAPVELTAGPTPFVTDEDSSDDFFYPVRTQTGTLQVCSKLQSGGIITLDDLLPANNIARPIRLYRIVGNNFMQILEWQGFLSCEAYSQDYTGIPQILDLPVLSVLEAMASVQVNIDRMTGIEKINKILYNSLHEIDIQSGITNFLNIHYDELSADIFNKYLDQSNLYKVKECGGYEQVFAMLDAANCKDMVTRLCTFMGWVAREVGADIYLQRIGSDGVNMCKQTLSSFNTGTSSYTSEEATESPILTVYADKWRGTGHRRTFVAGAKSVNISANVEPYDLDLTLPECPKQSLATNPLARWNEWGEYHANTIRNYYDYISFQSIRMDILAGENHYDAFEANMTVLQSLQYAETILWKDVAWYTDMEYLAPPAGTMSGNYTDYTTAFLNVSSGWGNGRYTDGLVVIAEPYEFYYGHESNVSRGMDLSDDIDPSYYLYKQRSVRTFYAANGKIKIQTGQLGYITMFNGIYLHGQYEIISPQLLMAIQWGNKWAYIDNSGITPQYKWVSGFQSFFMPLDSNNGLEFPVTAANNGEVTVYIFPVIKGRVAGTFSPSGALMDDTISGVRLTRIDITYESETSDVKNDGKENNYFRLLKTNFRDEISIQTEIASDLNNNMSPSLLMTDETTPASTITMDNKQVKPEIDLLDRLSDYYSAARQRIDLDVEHSALAPLPLLKLDGINDDKVYLPLSESRDWQTGVCKLTCFESTEEPAES